MLAGGDFQVPALFVWVRIGGAGGFVVVVGGRKFLLLFAKIHGRILLEGHRSRGHGLAGIRKRGGKHRDLLAGTGNRLSLWLPDLHQGTLSEAIRRRDPGIVEPRYLDRDGPLQGGIDSTERFFALFYPRGRGDVLGWDTGFQELPFAAHGHDPRDPAARARILQRRCYSPPGGETRRQCQPGNPNNDRYRQRYPAQIAKGHEFR
mmetsp:Transcript_22944/g.49964  ORF Transcript_22944/g.49964 Transcript_22944/m.49964 type:complete len:205 (+) Transcript_22944:680-1294(+)